MFRSSLLGALLLVGISGTLAAQQATEEQRAAVRSACRADFTANCSGVEPGTKAALMCLVSNETKLSRRAGRRSALLPRSRPRPTTRHRRQPMPRRQERRRLLRRSRRRRSLRKDARKISSAQYAKPAR
jgi:hypothetical protein